MRVVVKLPTLPPVSTEIGEQLTDLQRAVGGHVEQCLKHDNVIMWCDGDARMRRPVPTLNVYRPIDLHALYGPLVVTGIRQSIEGMVCASLTDREAALWMALLAMCSAGHADDKAAKAILDLIDRIDPRDRPIIGRVARSIEAAILKLPS
jgi:hypothetical protein